MVWLWFILSKGLFCLGFNVGPDVLKLLVDLLHSIAVAQPATKLAVFEQLKATVNDQG